MPHHCASFRAVTRQTDLNRRWSAAAAGDRFVGRCFQIGNCAGRVFDVLKREGHMLLVREPQKFSLTLVPLALLQQAFAARSVREVHR